MGGCERRLRSRIGGGQRRGVAATALGALPGWIRGRLRGRGRHFRCEGRPRAKPWTRLDQALRATDLLLQAGGFAAIVLDLGGIAPEHGSRIPSATWFRFRQAADHARCSLVVLGKTAYAQSSAAVVLKCAPMRARTAGGVVLHGFSLAVHRERERFTAMPPETRKPTGPPTTDLCGWGGKPPASTWTASAAWDAENRGPTDRSCSVG